MAELTEEEFREQERQVRHILNTDPILNATYMAMAAQHLIDRQLEREGKYVPGPFKMPRVKRD